MTSHTPRRLGGLFLACLIAGLVAATCLHAASPVPAFHPNDVIDFIGDSITDGGRARTGHDYNHTMGQDYAYILAATLGDRLAEKNLTFLNRGISGDTVVDLAKRWQRDVIDLKPNVLSILVGVNDTLSHKAESVADYEQTYDRLLRETLAALPGIRIVLGEPFLMPVGRHKANYAAELAEVKQRQAVVARLAAKYHLPLIRYQDAFDAALRRAPADHWSWDGIHPHYAGHALMADAWLKTTAAAWPASR